MGTYPLVTAAGLCKSFRRGSEVVQAVDDVSFTLEPGEMVALTGPSGSGKTTVLNMLAGWESPDEGDLLWGDEPFDPARADWQQLSVAPQRLGLLDELSIAENVDLPLRLGGREGWPDPDRLEVALRAFGLESMAHRMPWEVSLGEQQRTALARALVLTPKLLLADEPTGHQDAAWATGVMDGLRKACAAGTAVLVATHDEEVIAQIPRVLRMRDGRMT
jgi:putative ABC transport system ATP-binding protein